MRKVHPKTTCIKKPFQGNNFSPLGSMEIGGASTLLVQMVSTPMAPKTAKFGGMSGMSILFTSGYLLTSWYTLEWREFADNVTFRCVGVILIRIFFYCFSYVSYVFIKIIKNGTFWKISQASQCTRASWVERAKRITRADGGKSRGWKVRC